MTKKIVINEIKTLEGLDTIKLFEVNAKEFLKQLNKVKPFQKMDKGMQFPTAVLDLNNGTLSAGCGVSLIISDMSDILTIYAEQKTIIPFEILNIFRGIPEKNDIFTFYSVDETYTIICFKNHYYIFECNLSKPYPVDKVISMINTNNNITFNNSKLLKAFQVIYNEYTLQKRVNKNTSNSLFIYTTDNILHLAMILNDEVINITTECIADTDLFFSFNIEYINKLLKAFAKNDEITFKYSGDKNPTIWENDNQKIVMMPMRINQYTVDKILKNTVSNN